MSKNKITQAQRREIRSFVGHQYQIINEILRKRPKWVPLKLWAFGANIFINTKLLRQYMRNGISPKSKR